MQLQRRPAFLPILDQSTIMCPKQEQKEIAEAKSHDDEDYEDQEWEYYQACRGWTPNTGLLRWRDMKAFLATFSFLRDNLPLTVPEYKSVDAETGTGALTRFAELRPIGQVTITQLDSFAACGWAGGEVAIHAYTAEYLEFMRTFARDFATRAHAHERWCTLSVRIDVAEDCDDMEVEAKKNTVNVLGSNMMHAYPNSAVLFADLIEAAVRKNYKRVQDQLAAMIVAETRPLTTDLGWVMHTSPLKERQLYSLIGSFLL